MFKNKINILSFLVLAVMIGCSSTSNWPQFSGFLKDYKGMYRSEDIEGLFIIKHPTKNLNDYSKFLVDPVTVQISPDSLAYTMSDKIVEKTAKAFRQNIISALEQDFVVVNAPGKGVARIRVAITEIFKAGESPSAKGIIEAEFIDTYTRERIGAVLTSDKGMHFDQFANLISSRVEYLNEKTKIYKIK